MNRHAPGVDTFRDCFDGVVPGMVATIGQDGLPNLAYASQALFIDDDYLALSFQFFNNTRRNILAHPYARLVLVHPYTAAQYRLKLHYQRTEEEGALFETMKAKLASIASHTGMSGVFRLKGADIYRILAIEQVPGTTVPPPARRNALAALRQVMNMLQHCTDLDQLCQATLDALARHFDIDHSMILMLDHSARRLYTVASRGYGNSGVGSEIPLGAGVVGVAAEQAMPIRIGHFSAEYAYGQAVRDGIDDPGLLDTEIPLPGLEHPQSQLALPITVGACTLGVLHVESEQHLRFSYDDEDALVALSNQLGLTIRLLQQAGDSEAAPDLPVTAAPVNGHPIELRHYAENDSVFLGGHYLIKGVAGSILWALARDYVEAGRTEFSNRELRLDPRIKLPDLSDNLEARLLLLSRRLEERQACLRLEKAGRGRMRLVVHRPLTLLSAH
ncbi:MAG TPA: GAF domain-containing protein [Macromonas sp.]|nr:GAF domain-containing protein [Macromonas sp.]